MAYFFFFFFLFVRWKLQSSQWRRQCIAGPQGFRRACRLWECGVLQSSQWRWQCIAGPWSFRRACRLQECGVARFPLWVARRWSRTAIHVLLSDCQYRDGIQWYRHCNPPRDRRAQYPPAGQSSSSDNLYTENWSLLSHLHTLNISHSDKCPWGTSPHAPNHILQSCPSFNALRRHTWPSLVDVHGKLWGPDETLQQTADFASLTRLKI